MIAPKLRFPEFSGTEDWEIEPLGNIYSFISTNSFTRDDLNYESGTVKNIHYGDIHTRFATLFDTKKELVPFVNESISLEKISAEAYCIEGDVIFADASEDLKDVGKSIEVFSLNNEKVLSGMHTLQARQKEKKLVVGFAGHLFISEDIRRQIKREAQGAKVFGVSATRLSNTIIFYPKNKTEQQKITSCLSSLDDLITAHTQKLDALKANKKGLMQQLFPAEGEKVPKQRFAEFKDSGEWEEKMIGEISKVTTGNKDTQNKVDNGLYPFFVRSQTIERINSFSYDGEAILTSGDGVGVGKNFHYINGKFDFHQRVYCIYDFVENVFGKYLYLYFSEHFNNRVMKMTAKNSVDSVRMAMITEMPILIPSLDEQKKIAFCLSSLDELVTAQANKIEQLKNHKKGLMQGLFPILNK